MVLIIRSLGRPASFRLEDSDVPLPAYMDDEYIDETSFRAMPEGHIPQLAPAIELAILIRISCSAAETLFRVSKGKSQRNRYAEAVLALEKELLDWKERVPPYICIDPFLIITDSAAFNLSSPPEKTPFWNSSGTLMMLYVSWIFIVNHARYNELRLLIRHPSMARLSPSPAFFKESMAICAEASRNILAIINRFREVKQFECHPQVFSTTLFLTDRVFPP
jgi:hypothetical protein